MTGSYFPLALDEEMIWSQLPGRSLPAAAFVLTNMDWGCVFGTEIMQTLLGNLYPLTELGFQLWLKILVVPVFEALSPMWDTQF